VPKKSPPPVAPDAQARPRRRRGGLTPEEILDAAEQIAAAGFDGLTIRAVATALGSSPMALYRYFATKGELVDALLDRVLGRFDPPPPTDDWLRDLRGFAEAHRRLIAEHPWSVTVLFSHPSPGINAVVIGETALGVLRRGGITGEPAVVAFSAILALNYGWSGFALARDAAVPDDRRAPSLEEGLLALPPEMFPLTIGVAHAMAVYGSDAHYASALDQLLTGIASTTAA
jgi:AcrR family transcriptional regulator